MKIVNKLVNKFMSVGHRTGRVLISGSSQIFILLIIALALFWLWAVSPRLEGDTAALIHGTIRAIECQNQHIWPCSGVVHFPLYQYIPTAIVHRG